MSKAFFVFPHQLFRNNFTLSKNFIFYLLEEPLFFNQYKFHKQKLIFHRASMKYYEDKLVSLGFTVRYIDCEKLKNLESVLQLLSEDKVEEIHYCQVVDDWLEQKIRKSYAVGFKLKQLDTPMFLCSEKILKQEFDGDNHFSMASFYISQRKRLGILLNNERPVGGKWSLDVENRKKLPKRLVPPKLFIPSTNKYTTEAFSYIKANHSEHVGYASSFIYAVTHKDAQRCLQDFLINRLELFGTYEDAISIDHTFNYHSILSPYLNSGLLTPEDVLVEVINFSDGVKIPLNSLEGFIRQIIGWREFMRAVYFLKGRRERTKNFWNHENDLPQCFYEGSTGIAPVDIVIDRVLNNAYSHHIERLMVMGNFMLLCEINPDKVYQWFMEMYIDAYDWVMVPNVYSMSQYAGGGLATTKPYISGSNYILKMSDFKKEEWSKVWDGLYWRFIDKNKEFFAHNPRLSVMTFHLKKMTKMVLKEHYREAEKFMNKFF